MLIMSAHPLVGKKLVNAQPNNKAEVSRQSVRATLHNADFRENSTWLAETQPRNCWVVRHDPDGTITDVQRFN